MVALLIRILFICYNGLDLATAYMFLSGLLDQIRHEEVEDEIVSS